MKPEKITLGDAREQGDHWVTFNCCGSPADVFCRRSGKARLSEMIARFGPDVRLDQLPAKCTACGGDNIDTRSRPQKRVGGFGAGAFDPDDA